MNDLDTLLENGTAQTVGSILGDSATPPSKATRLAPARLPDAPEYPEPGIYFGMDENAYHAIEACSASGLKRLAISSMDYWAGSNLNPDREEQESTFLALGKAYHKRIVEGAAAYAATYAIELDPRDYPDALRSTDQIKAAIIETGEKPVTRIGTGQWQDKPTKAEPDKKVEVTRAAVKDDLVKQLLAISPDAEIWESMVAKHFAANAGRTMISAKQHRRIEIAARMIEGDTELSKAFVGGHPEVAIFWYCPTTGAPMKAKLDYLKLKAIVDLKSFSNSVGRPIDRAIDFAISGQRHYIGVTIYREAVRAAKQMIRDLDANAIFSADDASEEVDRERIAWCMKLAEQQEPPVALWVYQQTGEAPVTRGRIMPVGSVFSITDGALQSLKRRYVTCTRAFGTDPWIDVAPIRETVDEEIPASATDF